MCRVILPHIPTHIPRILTAIPRIPTQIPLILTAIPCILSPFPAFPSFRFPDSPFRLLLIADQFVSLIEPCNDWLTIDLKRVNLK